MSKLFDTLEQIRKNEAAKASGPNTIPVSKSKKKKLTPRTISLILIPIFLVVGIYVSLPYLSSLVQQNISRLAKQEQRRTPIETPPKTETKPIKTTTHQTTATSNQVKPNVAPAPQKTSSQVSKANASLQEFVSFNNKGTELISNNRYWEGIRYLNKAAELQPKRVEPLINIGVALAELGLYGPALRYFKKALVIDPNNQKTLDNITLLTEAGFLDMAM